MVPKSTLLSTTGPYSGPDESCPHFPTLFPRIHSNIIFLSMPRSSAQSHPFRFSNKNTVHIPNLSHVP
jgi:hypothetical protein